MHRRVRPFVQMAALILLGSCSDRDVDDESVVDGILIPLEPVAQPFSSGLWVELDASGPSIRIEQAFTFAVARDYPDEITLPVKGPFYAECGVVSGELSVHEVTGAVEAIAAAPTDEGIGLDIRSAGAADLAWVGALTVEEPLSCDLAAGVTIPVEGSVLVEAVRPAGVAFDTTHCEGAMPPVAPAMRHNLRLRLVDADGEVFDADNVTTRGQATVQLRGAPAEPEHPPTSLLAWWPPPTPGIVEVVPRFGDPLRIDVIDPARVTAATVEFQLGNQTLVGPLESGATYGEEGWQGAANRISARVQAAHVGGIPLCGLPDPDWFELESNTPDVCEIEETEIAEDKIVSFTGIGTGRHAVLKRDGTCTLTLHAPELPEAKNFPLSFSATFVDVAELDEV